MPIESDHLSDWTYHTNYKEGLHTFVVSHRVTTDLKPPPQIHHNCSQNDRPKLIRDDHYLVPYTPMPDHHYHFTLTPTMHLAQQRRLRHRAGDIVVMPYPRSGCTWLEHMVLLLLVNGDGENLDIAQKNTYNPEFPQRAGKILIDVLYHGLPPGVDVCSPWGTACGQDLTYNDEEIEKMSIHEKYPRVFKSHYPVSMALRGQNGEKPPVPGVKYVMMVRDPKDVVVSLFRVNSLNLQGMGMPFTPFVKLFLDGKTYMPSWATFHAEWLSLARVHPKQILVLTYEGAVREPLETMKRIATFLQLECSDDEKVLKRCVDLSSFSYMKEMAKGAKAEHIHVGKAGGWKEWMSKEMVEAFNDMLNDERLGEFGPMYTVDSDVAR